MESLGRQKGEEVELRSGRSWCAVCSWPMAL
jgi:hypothetical protein